MIVFDNSDAYSYAVTAIDNERDFPAGSGRRHV
jgi:hypothetical protein